VDIVVTAADRYCEVEHSGHSHGLHNILDVVTGRNRCRTRLDRPVVDRAAVVVVTLDWPEQPARERWSGGRGESDAFSHR